MVEKYLPPTNSLLVTRSRYPQQRSPLPRRHVKITSIWLDSKFAERERETGSSGSGGGRECTWQIPVCWRKGRRCTGSADKSLGPTIHHDPRLSACHFRFGWRARRINYRDSSSYRPLFFSPRIAIVDNSMLLFDRAFPFLTNIRPLFQRFNNSTRQSSFPSIRNILFFI